MSFGSLQLAYVTSLYRPMTRHFSTISVPTPLVTPQGRHLDLYVIVPEGGGVSGGSSERAMSFGMT